MNEHKKVSSLLLRAHLQGWFVIIFGFFGFFTWAATYPIDQGIAGTGFVITKAERIGVIAPSSGLVTTLTKQVGDSVKVGDMLVEYESRPQEANLRSIQESIRRVSEFLCKRKLRVIAEGPDPQTRY